MACKTYVLVFMCVGLFVAIQTTLPKAAALRQRSDMDGLMAAEERARMQQNEFRKTLYNEYASDMDRARGSVRPVYNVKSLPWPAEETVPDLIVVANMIRNDANILDNSIPNGIQKTGNIKVKKEDKTIPDDNCNCEKSIETVDLTKDWGNVYPYTARNVTCSDNCAKPFTCKPKLYNMTILKRRPQALALSLVDMDQLNRGHDMPLPKELVRHWAPAALPVTIGCYCTLP